MISKYVMDRMPLRCLMNLTEQDKFMLNKKSKEIKNASVWKILSVLLAIGLILTSLITNERMWLAAVATTLMGTFIMNWVQKDDEKELDTMIADIIIKQGVLKEVIKAWDNEKQKIC